MNRKIVKIVGSLALIYVIYAVAGVYTYSLRQMNQSNLDVQSVEVKSLDDLSQKKMMNESVALNGNIEDSLALRGELIDQAETNLSLAQYKIANDESGLYIVKKLEAAAKRGVEILLLVNNLSNRTNSLSNLSLLDSYDNVEIKVVGGYNVLHPWETNNVLHDKFMLVDDTYFLSSGRSMSNRFLLPTSSRSVTEDMDILIKKEGILTRDSLIIQGREYFDELWAMDYSKKKKNYSDSNIFARNKVRLDKLDKKFNEDYGSLFEENRLETMDYYPINNGHLAFNETNSLVKKPVVWKQISTLVNQAEQEVDLMSPYVVVSNKMFPYLDLDASRELHIYTNSGANSPNLLSFGGYLKQKDQLMDGSSLWELQSEDFNHQKALSVDEQVIGVGSFNLDSRSTFLSSESMLIINSPMAVKELGNIMHQYEEKSLQAESRYDYKEMDEESVLSISKPKKWLLNSISVFSPLFRIFL